MGNGVKDGEKNVASFIQWAATQTDDDFLQHIRGGQLNRSYVVKGVGCGRSALLQNPQLRSLLENLESDLRERGILPPVAPLAASDGKPLRQHDPKANASLKADQRASALEKEVVALRAENAQLKASLSRYGELSEVIGELGLIPQ